MHKAIQLKVKLWIEGEDEPAHDFAASTIQAVQAILATSHRRYPKLTITIKQIVEDSDDEEDGDDRNDH